MTPQAIFDKVATHLLKQGERSMEGSACAYRGAHGKMCAVGALIPDDLYDPNIESSPARSLGVGRLLVKAGVLEQADIETPLGDGQPKHARATLMPDKLTPRMSLLRCLQRMHDDESPLAWRRCLRDIAKQFDLSPAILEAA